MRKVTENKETNLDTLGKRINAERTKMGISQQDLANKLLIKREKINYIEKDSRLPNIQELIEISSVLNVSTDYLLGIVTSKNSDNIEISKVLGLDDNCIAVLKSIKEYSKSDIINNLFKEFNLIEFNYNLIEYFNISLFHETIFLPFYDEIGQIMRSIDWQNKKGIEISEEAYQNLKDKISIVIEKLNELKKISPTTNLINMEVNERELLEMFNLLESKRDYSYIKVNILIKFKEKLSMMQDIIRFRMSSDFSSALNKMKDTRTAYLNPYNK